jgi:hypothetical protein
MSPEPVPLVKSRPEPVDVPLLNVLSGASRMDENKSNRRSEERLRYAWPVWFSEDFNGILSQGQMVDLSSRGAAFSCRAGDDCPCPGQHLTARFSVPQYVDADSFEMADFFRSGRVCRVEEMNPYSRKVAVQFSQPLPFKPGEQPAAGLTAGRAVEQLIV